MKPEAWARIEELFERARQCPPTLRAAFLDETCADQAELRAEVESLLRACDVGDSPLDTQGADALLQIGNYRILDVLGVGGMGTVYFAEQREPVQRQVALKVIKLGMDSDAVLRRFEVERQALAMMNHDNIAKVFEAGTTERGQPYFVMEHVPGVPITEHCDRQGLGTRERIELFRCVCEGVQHAHQKGIIHRDLKPTNVLVALDERGRAVPKIIDFGLARATDRQTLQQNTLTEQGLTIGTPEFMSPEQIETSTTDIDTRTDIFSLGVMLYELLSGSLPFPSAELRSQGLAELQRTICEVEPPRPSSRVAKLDTQTAATSRGTTVLALARDLRHDLDWITMMAMAKDRSRRYTTSAEFAEDLDRYLKHEPVRAGPPSATYRCSKFLRRHRAQAIAAAIILLTLVGGLIGTTAFAFEASHQRNIVQQRVDEFDMLAAVIDLDQVRDEERRFYPAWPDQIEAMQIWLDKRAGPSLAARVQLEATIKELATRGLTRSTEQFLHRELEAHLERLSTFERTVVANVKQRMRWAESIEERSIARFAEEWERARQAIANSEHYREHTVDLRPQLGLVPIGPDPVSGLWEFYHLRSAAPDSPIPTRDAEGRLAITGVTGIVLVLVPGGRFQMGAQCLDAKAPNFDELAVTDEEMPVHEVTLAPFFIARHEVTQAQWMRLNEGQNPSVYMIGTESENVPRVTPVHPVENVSWLECDLLMRQLGLSLPTEAQWEYAARAESDSPWSTGEQYRSLEGATNLADESLARAMSDVSPCWEGFDDGFAIHAPVDLRRPNRFGLHFVHGNVWEWCLDRHVPYSEPVRMATGLRGEYVKPVNRDRAWHATSHDRVHRGGAYSTSHVMARSSRRNFVDGEQKTQDIGLRAARAIRE